MKMNINKFCRENRGIAMTETALLCFFLYVPVLLMVIIWGEMTLDKTRAHIANSYIAFSGREPDEGEILDTFFPGAGTQQDDPIAVREAYIESARLEHGPYYELPLSPTGDYSGDAPEYDLQYKLYSLAMGRIDLTHRFDAFDGGVGWEIDLHIFRNDMARYLNREGIVDVLDREEIEEIVEGFEGRPGDSIEIDTGKDSRAYTKYVEALTAMYNDALTGEVPRSETRSVLRTSYRSPFFRELEREYDRTTLQSTTLGSGLPDSFEMRFGPSDVLTEGSQWREDTSFHSGYSYLRNRAAYPDGNTLLEDFAALGINDMFNNHDGINAGQMPLSISEDYGPDHMRFLEPGDPR